MRSLSFSPFATLSFALFGALLVLVGITQDELALAIDLDLSRSGLLASSLVLGIGAGVLAAGPLVDRLPRRMLFGVSAGAVGLALLTVDASMGFSRALAHLLVAGMGGGLYETLLNTETIERYQERAVRMMTLLHAATTVGAMAAPLLVNVLTGAGLANDWTMIFRLIGAAHLVLVAFALVTPFSEPTRQIPVQVKRERVLTPGLAALCVASFAYVGVESALTAFSIPYAVEALDLAPERGRTAISTLWLGLLAGRLVFAWRVKTDSSSARPAILAGGTAAAALFAGVALQWTAIEVLVAIVGFALGSVFPMLVALAGRRTPHATGSAVGLVAGLGSLGGFAIPWLTGVAGDRIGIAAAIGGLSLWCVVVAFAALFAERGPGPRRAS